MTWAFLANWQIRGCTVVRFLSDFLMSGYYGRRQVAGSRKCFDDKANEVFPVDGKTARTATSPNDRPARNKWSLLQGAGVIGQLYAGAADGGCVDILKSLTEVHSVHQRHSYLHSG